MSIIDLDEDPLFDVGDTHEPDDDTGDGTGKGTVSLEGVTIPGDIVEFGNGLLPDSALQPIGIGSHRLHRAAAEAFGRWRAVASAAGIDLTCTDSYRTLAQQKQLKEQKPTLSATPGRSVHGWGFAVDVSIGMPPKGFGQTVFQWLKDNGPPLGWHLGRPKDEPWHWVYRGESGSAAPLSTPGTSADVGGDAELVSTAEVKLGSSGVLVRIARGLLELPAGDAFDEATDAAARAFQQANALTVDGRVGPKTWAKLRSVTAPAERPTLFQGSSGEEVRWVQRRIAAIADGQFGPKTNASVLSFQRAAGVAADGRVGPITWGALTR